MAGQHSPLAENTANLQGGDAAVPEPAAETHTGREAGVKCPDRARSGGTNLRAGAQAAGGMQLSAPFSYLNIRPMGRGRELDGHLTVKLFRGASLKP